jgi:MFS transporter, ACS family, pantothenate transporter
LLLDQVDGDLNHQARMKVLLKLRRVVWGAPASTKAERRLIVKLDFFILSFCCLMYWVNYLDRANLNNAYVSGMKEDLNFQGAELNVINTGMSFIQQIGTTL